MSGEMVETTLARIFAFSRGSTKGNDSSCGSQTLIALVTPLANAILIVFSARGGAIVTDITSELAVDSEI